MYRKKEWLWILGLIFVLVLFLAWPFSSEQTNEVTNPRRKIEVTVEGAIFEEKTFVYYEPLTYRTFFENIALLLKSQSDLSGFDLSEMITSSQTIYIPYQTDAEISSEKIHINTAEKEELMNLYQIKEKRADKIIAYRKNYGTIETWEEFQKIVGISDADLGKIKEQAVL